jgi:hypothetical protein
MCRADPKHPQHNAFREFIQQVDELAETLAKKGSIMHPNPERREINKDAFKDCITVKEVLGQLAGAASMCWEPAPTGVFESEYASEFVELAHSRITQLILTPETSPRKAQ